MKLHSAYLTSIDICRTKTYDPVEFMIFSDLARKDIYRYSSDNQLLSSHLYYDIFHYIPDFWKDLAHEALFRGHAIPGYFIYYYTLKIIPEHFSQIIRFSSESTYEYDNNVKNLVETLRSADFHLEYETKIEKHFHGTLSFAHLIPETPLTTSKGNSASLDRIHEVNDYLELSGSAALPSHFRGCLFFTQRTISHPDHRAIVVSLSSPTDVFARNSNSFYSVFLDYCQFRAYSSICGDLERRLLKSVFNHQDIGSYTKEIGNLRSLDTSQSKIIDDRMQSIRLRFRMKNVLNSLSRGMRFNSFRHLDSSESHDKIALLNNDSPNFSSRWFFLTKYENSWNSAVQSARNTIEETKENEGIFSDYLRDLLVGRSTSANLALQKVNLSLQKGVRNLTKLATVLAVFGFSWSLLPERKKEEFFYFLVEIWDSFIAYFKSHFLSML